MFKNAIMTIAVIFGLLAVSIILTAAGGPSLMKKHQEGVCDLCHHDYGSHDMSKASEDETPCWECPKGVCK